jgi:hypothetical protein
MSGGSRARRDYASWGFSRSIGTALGRRPKTKLVIGERGAVGRPPWMAEDLTFQAADLRIGAEVGTSVSLIVAERRWASRGSGLQEIDSAPSDDGCR